MVAGGIGKTDMTWLEIASQPRFMLHRMDFP
jgi:hypothetical protein